MSYTKNPATWKIYLALMLLCGSYFGLLYTALYVKDELVILFFFIIALLGGLISLSLAQDDGSRRKEVDPAQVEEIRREARQRCLEEAVALIRRKDIESGIGVDVPRAYYPAIQGANGKK